MWILFLSLNGQTMSTENWTALENSKLLADGSLGLGLGLGWVRGCSPTVRAHLDRDGRVVVMDAWRRGRG